MFTKRLSVISILVALILIASFIAAALPKTIGTPQKVYAAGTRTVTAILYSQTWNVPSNVYSVTVLVVAGGGGGGGAGTAAYQGGGGGAGGSILAVDYSVTPGAAMSVTVGPGGAGAAAGNNNGNPGGNSVFGTITATGGGYGGTGNGGPGGSGGGAGCPSADRTGGDADYLSPIQGKDGGNGKMGTNSGGGGGGNSSKGTNGDGSGHGGAGGSGYDWSEYFGTTGGVPNNCVLAGGGGGGGYTSGGSGQAGGGNGAKDHDGYAFSVNNTGSGGGGGSRVVACCSGLKGGTGAYGCVLIAYTTYTLTTATNNSAGGTPTSGGSYTAGHPITINANNNSGYTVTWAVTSGSATFNNLSATSTNVTLSSSDATVTFYYSLVPSNSAPTITSVTLQDSGKTTPVSAMTPQTAYVVEIVAGDADTIDDINQIDIWVFRDDNAGDDGAPVGAWDCDHEAIYRWAKSGSTWSMQNGGATTTWSITTGSCDTPGNMAATSGEWNLYFTVGKLAQESDGSTAEWDIKVTVTDAGALAASLPIYSKSMGAYSSLSLSDSTIGFGNIALGGTAAIQSPVAHYVTLQAISNDAFALGSKSSSPWTNGASNANLDENGGPASTYFSLTQDDSGDGNGHPTTPQYVTTSTVTITGLGAVARTSTAAGDSESTNNTNIYMDCILGASGLKVVTYSGTITFTITNS